MHSSSQQFSGFGSRVKVVKKGWTKMKNYLSCLRGKEIEIRETRERPEVHDSKRQ